MPRNTLHPAESISQRKPVQADEDLTALQPCQDKFSQTNEKGSNDPGEQKAVSTIVGSPFQSLYGVIHVEKSPRNQSQHNDGKHNLRWKGEGMGNPSQFFCLGVTDTIGTHRERFEALPSGQPWPAKIHQGNAAQSLPHPPVSGGKQNDYRRNR